MIVTDFSLHHPAGIILFFFTLQGQINRFLFFAAILQIFSQLRPLTVSRGLLDGTL